MVATRPVDFRKGPDALAALVGKEYGGDPYSGVIYVFRAKRADRIKLVWWDGTLSHRRSPVDGVRDR
ncbi:transposase [Sphingobium xanthum]|uniref:IS66 family insertion sequence element accessory protein TnpB n=1 Tax=Sphingobium xanthum TaxID=1387165 RepID=UPI001C8C9247|nr:IS66 family insertion sequence element accessory protein TnpB [Sphingobium xanthum]